VEHPGLGDEPGEHDAHADARRAQVAAQALAEPAQAELRGRVDARPGRRGLARQRRHEQDVARAPRGHALAQPPGEDHRGPQVHLERTVDLLLAEAEQPARPGQRRVGDEDVDVRAEVREPPDLCAVPEVDGVDLGAADLRRERVEDGRAPAGEHEPRAGSVQAPRDRVPEPARGPGEEDRPAHELHRRGSCQAPPAARRRTSPALSRRPRPSP
jgi:hypothetical protein